LNIGFAAVKAQETKWTPEEKRELFNYCEKPDLIKQLNFSEEMANKIGDIDYWELLQNIKIQNNTNDTFATSGEIREEAIKKYNKEARLSGDQVKALLSFKAAREAKPSPCEVIELHYNAAIESMDLKAATLQYQAKFRKPLTDKLGINGRQANLLCENEVSSQKEAADIANIPKTDFNRIRKTVAHNQDLEKRFRSLGLDDAQVMKALAFFRENSL
jgi:hypothetical protein